MSGSLERLRNIGIIAHIDAGKTTTTERILYFSGTVHRMGDVDDGNTTTDFDPEEAERGITIYSACVTTRWKDAVINLIDTPGHVDFTAEVERCLRVLDGAVVVFSAVEGVEAQSETVWRQADRYNVPRLCFINKLDRIGADWWRTVEEIGERLCPSTHSGTSRKVVPVNIPADRILEPGQADIRSIVDIIDRKLLTFLGEAENWQVQSSDLTPEALQRADEWRGKLIDVLSDYDGELADVYLNEGDVSAERLRRSLRQAVVQGLVVPIFCGTSLRCVGVQPLLDGVVDYLPSPLDRPPIEGADPDFKGDERKTITRKPDPKGPFSALVFKIVADKHNDLYFLRVYSGTVKAGSRMLNPRTQKKEFLTQLWHVQADSRERVDQDEARAGDIVGVVGLKESVTGDTLSDPKSPIVFEEITFPENVISMAVEPESSAERDKLEQTLKRLTLQDPTFGWSIDEETGQTIVTGMGELHLEVVRNRMERDFNVRIKVHRPRVTYKETVSQSTQAEGVFDKVTASGPNFAHVKLTLAHNPSVVGVRVVSHVPPQNVPAVHRDALDRAVKDEAQAGLSGFAMTQLEVAIDEFKHQPGATNENAIYAAVASAFQTALQRAGCTVLEPIMRLEVFCPEESIGSVQSDLNARRAIVTSSEPRGKMHVIEAQVPLAKMFGYSSVVRSLTQGRAAYSMEPDHYAPASELPDYA